MRDRGLVVVALALALAGAFPGTARAGLDGNGIYPMTFPVQGPNSYTDTFGDPRGGHLHEGQDIMTYGVKGVPVVAAADGRVKWIGTSCCYLAIEHDDGWQTWYIHLNNDRQNPDGTYSDDGQGWGIAQGITVGTRVTAGQLIGWVGDSGNAEWTAPHLHFELRDPSGVAVNAYNSLRAAELAPGDPVCPDGLDCDTVAFQDFAGRFHLFEDVAMNSPKDVFYYGVPGDVPFSGDWNCDGVETLGLYRRSDGYVYLRNSNTQGVADISFYFGIPGDYPVAGDFDGNGCDSVSIYRPREARFYVINQIGSNDAGLGSAEYSFLFGVVGDKPFVGDYNGDGVDTIGLHRESTGLVYFRDSNTTGVADSQFFYGIPNDKLVAGDWDGDGDDTVGVYRRSDGKFYVKLDNTQGVADVTIPVGTYTGIVALDP